MKLSGTNLSISWLVGLLLSMTCVGSHVRAQDTGVMTLSPRNSGPIDIADLSLLLASHTLFQVFDISMEEASCLRLGYVHEVDGPEYGVQDGLQIAATDRAYLCAQPGAHRLLVVMKPIGDRWAVSFGVHDRSLGTGGSYSYSDIDVEADILHTSLYLPSEIDLSSEPTTLLSWTLTDLRGGDTRRNEILIQVSFLANPNGWIGSGPLPHQ